MPQPLGFMMLYDYEGLGGAPALEEITDETFAILGSSNVKIGLKYLPASGNAYALDRLASMAGVLHFQ